VSRRVVVVSQQGPPGPRGPTGPAGGGSGSDIPIADPSGVTVDTTTYDNPITGSGKLTTLVFPRTTAAIAFALEGDAFPRWIFSSDPVGDDITLGDGTHGSDDGKGAFIGSGPAQTDGTQVLNISGGGGGFVLGLVDANRGHVNRSNLPWQFNAQGALSFIDTDPSAPSAGPGGDVGDICIRTNGGVGSTIYRCTVAGTTGNTTWDAIL
jgi:hypothetical protein